MSSTNNNNFTSTASSSSPDAQNQNNHRAVCQGECSTTTTTTDNSATLCHINKNNNKSKNHYKNKKDKNNIDDDDEDSDITRQSDDDDDEYRHFPPMNSEELLRHLRSCLLSSFHDDEGSVGRNALDQFIVDPAAVPGLGGDALLGQGTYANVFRAILCLQSSNAAATSTEETTRMLVAKKVFTVDRDQAIHEATIFLQLHHQHQSYPENIVRFFAATVTPHHNNNKSQICLILELATQNFKELLYENGKKISLHVAEAFAMDIALGLEYLHVKAKLVHCDMKPANILEFDMSTINNNDSLSTESHHRRHANDNDDDDNHQNNNNNSNNNSSATNSSSSRLKIGDLGSARKIKSVKINEVRSTEKYAPREYKHNADQLSIRPSFDVYSFGKILSFILRRTRSSSLSSSSVGDRPHHYLKSLARWCQQHRRRQRPRDASVIVHILRTKRCDDQIIATFNNNRENDPDDTESDDDDDDDDDDNINKTNHNSSKSNSSNGSSSLDTRTQPQQQNNSSNNNNNKKHNGGGGGVDASVLLDFWTTPVLWGKGKTKDKYKPVARAMSKLSYIRLTHPLNLYSKNIYVSSSSPFFFPDEDSSSSSSPEPFPQLLQDFVMSKMYRNRHQASTADEQQQQQLQNRTEEREEDVEFSIVDLRMIYLKDKMTFLPTVHINNQKFIHSLPFVLPVNETGFYILRPYCEGPPKVDRCSNSLVFAWRVTTGDDDLLRFIGTGASSAVCIDYEKYYLHVDQAISDLRRQILKEQRQRQKKLHQRKQKMRSMNKNNNNNNNNDDDDQTGKQESSENQQQEQPDEEFILVLYLISLGHTRPFRDEERIHVDADAYEDWYDSAVQPNGTLLVDRAWAPVPVAVVKLAKNAPRDQEKKIGLS